MELKEYQTRALDAFVRWRDALDKARRESLEDIEDRTRRGRPVPADVLNYPKAAWQQLAAAGEVAHPELPYVERTAAAGYAIPHICFKVPTGGGKTLLAAAALERLNRPAGLVLWLVPSNAIYQQTKTALWNREHPYRQMLERASGGRVKMLEKDDLFTAADLAHYLCVMLICLADACGIFSHLLTRRELSQVTERIEEVRRFDLIGQAMSQAIQDIEISVAASVQQYMH